MKSTRQFILVRRITTFISLLVFLFINTAYSQDFSGLQNKDLTKIDDVSGVISGLISKLDGKIDKVTVTYDSEKTLKVSVAYTGFTNEYLTAQIVDANKQKQKGISNISFTFDGKSSPLEMEFLLDESLPEGTEINSPFLEIKVAKKKSQFVKNTFLYTLNKNWKTEIDPQNLVIPLKLEPIGSAANLKENQQKIILPAKRPQLKYTFDKKKLVNLRPVTATTTTAIRPITTPRTTTTTTTSSTQNKIDGTWTNNNKNTTNITKVIVSENGKKIQIYRKCGTKDCDMGKKNLYRSRSSNTYNVTYKSNYYTDYFSLNFDSSLKLTRNKKYNSASIRNKRTTETFSRQLILMPLLTYTGGTTSTTEEEEEVSKEAQGPDNSPLSLWEDLVADNDFEFPYEITNIRMDIYPDKNLASGIFYYLPTAYHLRWNTDEGYNFKMLYGTADEGDTSGNVRMTGTLTPGISTNEIALMKSLLESYVKDNPIYTYTELKIMPYKTKPTLSLSSGLEGQYDISADKVNVTISSSITNPIDVSWVTDNTTKEEMQVALTEGVGIKGLMTIAPDSETIPEQLIPVRITLADTRTIGKLTLIPNEWRTKNWVNNTPFPIRLKMIHALIIEKQGNKSIPLIYSWNLEDQEVPAMASVQFDASKMPQWIETKNRTERIWIDYSIVECTTCVNKVIDELTGGTTNSKVKNITFESFKIFESTDAAFLKVKVRSKQADPKGESVIELPSVRITKDMEVFSTGPIYLQEGATPEFEYFFTLVTEDGVSHNSESWLTGTEVEMFIGMHNLNESIKTLSTDDNEED